MPIQILRSRVNVPSLLFVDWFTIIDGDVSQAYIFVKPRQKNIVIRAIIFFFKNHVDILKYQL